MLNENAPVIDRLFEAVIDSVEEAIIDSLFTAETVQGNRGLKIRALPVEALRARYRL